MTSPTGDILELNTEMEITRPHQPGAVPAGDPRVTLVSAPGAEQKQTSLHMQTTLLAGVPKLLGVVQIEDAGGPAWAAVFVTAPGVEVGPAE